MPDWVPHSSHWGSFLAAVDTGVRLKPLQEDTSPSALVGSLQDVLRHATRLRQPLIRKAFLRGDIEAARAQRGTRDFVAVTWDEALAIVCQELQDVRQRRGNEAIFGGSYGWSSAGRFHHAKSQLHRFLNQFGGFVDQEQNYSYAAAITFLPHVLGSYEAIQGPVSSLDGIAENCRLMLCFGGISPGNMQVEAGGQRAHNGLNWLRRCAEAKVRLVNISPVDHELPAGVAAEWIPIRPNTDTAMLLAIAYTIMREGLTDTDFLQRCCLGSEQFLSYVKGESDGLAKTPQWAEALCGVPANVIVTLARDLCRQRSFINLSWSLQRADHGEQPLWAAISVAAMIGQIGLPGGGFAFGLWSIDGMGNPRRKISTPRLPIGVNPVRRRIPVARISDMLLHPGQEYDFNGEVRRYPDIDLVYWCGGNPFHHHQDINRLVEAFRKARVVIVQDIFFTSTARHADIVLPATTTLERNDIGASGRDRSMMAMRKATPTFAGCRNDFDIFSELANRCGFESAFTEGRGEMQWLEHMWDEARKQAAAGGEEMPEFGQFWERGYFKLPAPEKPYTMFEEFRTAPQSSPLKTPSGRIELFSERIARFGYADCPGHAVWLEPKEWLGSPDASPSMLHLVSLQPATRLHSQLDAGRVSKSSKIRGREPCWIHPLDASVRGIADGDVVRVSNARGEILCGASVTGRVMRGVVVIATGAWYDPLVPGQSGTIDKHGNPNVLTRDQGSSKLTQAPAAQSVLVTVEKFEGALPPVTAHQGPAVESGPSN